MDDEGVRRLGAVCAVTVGTLSVVSAFAAIRVAHALPSPVDPTGLATFLVAGGVAAALGATMRRTHPRLGAIGVAVGIDPVVLFSASAARVDRLVLLSGGLASVVLGPLRWAGVARFLWAGEALPLRSEPGEIVLDDRFVRRPAVPRPA